MKKILMILGGTMIIGLFVALSFMLVYFPTSAQKNNINRWEYAAITLTYIPFNSENQPTIIGIANICYLQINGCQNEEISGEIGYSKFLQDSKLENTVNSRNYALNRAKEIAFSKAISKLGAEGWEMITQPAFEFDGFVPNVQGNFSVVVGNKSLTPNIYFKRLKQ